MICILKVRLASFLNKLTSFCSGFACVMRLPRSILTIRRASSLSNNTYIIIKFSAIQVSVSMIGKTLFIHYDNFLIR